MPETLNLNYYYGNEADQYSFYRIPKILLTDRRYKGVSLEAKVLYGLLLDRMGLSARNGWLDDNGRVFLYFTQEEVMTMLDCGKDKATKLFRELEGIGLVERKKQGQGHPARIYVKNFILEPESAAPVQTAENQQSTHQLCYGQPEKQHRQDWQHQGVYAGSTLQRPRHDGAVLHIPCQPRYGARAAEWLSRPALCNTSIKPKEDICMEHEINILVVEPGRPPRPARVDYSLETLSQLVGGELAMGCFLPQRVMLLYNENASRQGLPPNRCNPFVNECISGTFLLCGLSDGEGFCSLSPARQAEFQRLFASPGEFMMLGTDHICASPAEFAETAGRLWGSMASGESVVLTKWGGKEAGA